MTFNVGDFVSLKSRIGVNGINSADRFMVVKVDSEYPFVEVEMRNTYPHPFNGHGFSFHASWLVPYDYCPSGSLPQTNKTTKIKSVTLNEKEGKVTVVFGKNDYKIATCSKEDTFDPAIGIALALAYKQFGSKTQYHKYVNSVVEKSAKKIKKDKAEE